MVRLGGEGTPLVEEFAATEVGAALGMSTGAGRARLGDALDLVHRLPETLAALELGDVDGFRVRLLVRGTRMLDRDAARQVQDALLHRLAGMTPRAVERKVAEEAALADPLGAEERRSEARTAREVVVGESRDGVRDLWARLDAGSATRLDARVDQVADWLGEVGDTDPKVMRRATALGLLADPAVVESLWRQVEARRCGRPVTEDDAVVPLTVLHLHADATSGTAHRWREERAGAMTLDEAADLVGHSRVTVRPVIDLDDLVDEPPASGYIPSVSLAEAVRLAFETDVFPWGTAPARRCDLDHQVPWPIGPTSLTNLAPLGRGHHRPKTHGAWTVARTGPGVHERTSPTGRRFRVDRHGTRQLPRSPMRR